MDAFEALKGRHSTRRFAEGEVSEDAVRRIVEAGTLAATARNVQPWAFVVVRDASTRAAIADLTDYGKFLVEAPVCIAVLCQDTKYYLEDGCAATENILVAAEALGLGACWVAGDKKPYAPRIVEMLHAPSDYRLVALVALGPAAAAVPRAPKRNVDDVLHHERYGRRE